MRNETETVLLACREILSRYENAITVRQLYYRLVAALIIPNSLLAYKRLGQHLTKWRKQGELDPRVFTDLTRRPIQSLGWPDLPTYLHTAARSYRRDHWQGQSRQPEVWLEKEALATVFMPISKRLQVTLQVCRGYPSISTLIEAVDRGTTEIIYFGDWDPSGIDIDRCIRDEMGGTWNHPLRIRRIALLPKQIKKHRLPPVPPKDSDSRTSGFVAAHGEDTVELDALPPEALEALIERSVMAYVKDQAAWKQAHSRERADRRTLETYIASIYRTA